MTNEDKKAFAAVMVGMAENYGQTLTPQGIAMRFEALKAFEIHDVKAAAMSLICSRKYTTLPTVADLIERLGGGAAEDIAEVEAAKVIRAVSNHGAYRSVVFDNPTTQAVIERVFDGWPKTCEACADKWFRHEFIKSFAAFSRQGQKLFGHLPGLIELQNSSPGFEQFVPEPELVGNREKALAVLGGKTDLRLLDATPPELEGRLQ